MERGFSQNNPVATFNERKDKTDNDEQEEMMYLFKGMSLRSRNSRCHFGLDPQNKRPYSVTARFNFFVPGGLGEMSTFSRLQNKIVARSPAIFLSACATPIASTSTGYAKQQQSRITLPEGVPNLVGVIESFGLSKPMTLRSRSWSMDIRTSVVHTVRQALDLLRKYLLNFPK